VSRADERLVYEGRVTVVGWDGQPQQAHRWRVRGGRRCIDTLIPPGVEPDEITLADYERTALELLEHPSRARR
jgi:hypothetical protein